MPQYPTAFVANNAAGATSPGRVGALGDLWTAQRRASLLLTGFGGFSFSAATALTGVTTSVGLTTTYTGLCLSNPAGSGKSLALINVQIGQLVVPSVVTSFGLISGWVAGGITAHTTPLTAALGPIPTQLGQTVNLPVGLVDTACTLVGTPTWSRWFGSDATATTAGSFNVDINGAIVIPAGGYVAIGSNIASVSSGLVASFLWEEI